MRIGIPMFQDELNGRRGWVAGLHYVQSACYALSMLPADKRPEVHCFVPEDLEWAPASASETPSATLHQIPQALLNAGDFAGQKALAAHLQELVREHPVDCFFPLLTPPSFILPAPALGWIPDFQHHVLPQFFTEEDRNIRNHIFTFLSSYCYRIACSSEAARADLRRFYPGAGHKALLLRFRAMLPKHLLTPPVAPALTRLGIDEPYLYLPNQFWVHKDHATAFAAWKHLAQAMPSREVPLLVCTGNPEDYRARGHYQTLLAFLEENGLEKRIRMLGFISREDQLILYRAASAILQPSRFEGWSTSIEEARCLGKPLIASDIPIHQEQAPDALFFPVGDAAVLAEVVRSQWHLLPKDHSPEREQTAWEAYQTPMAQFGEDVLTAVTATVAAAAGDLNPQDRQHLANLFLEQRGVLEGCVSECERRLEVIQNFQRMLEAKDFQLLDTIQRADALESRVDALTRPGTAAKILIAEGLRRLGLGWVVEQHGRTLKNAARTPRAFLREQWHARVWRLLRKSPSQATPLPGTPRTKPPDPDPMKADTLTSGTEETALARALAAALQLSPSGDGLCEEALRACYSQAARMPSCTCLQTTPRTSQALIMLAAAGVETACIGCDGETRQLLERHGVHCREETLFQWIAATGPDLFADVSDLLWDASLPDHDRHLLLGRLWPNNAVLETGPPQPPSPEAHAALEASSLQGSALAPGLVLAAPPGYAWRDPAHRNRSYYRQAAWPGTTSPPVVPPHMPSGAHWPRISVVTVSYNQGQFIEETIQSVLGQGYPNLEFIIQDACSTDGTAEVLERYRHRITHLTIEKDGGQSDALNRGFAKATGEILCWLNTDDRYLPGTLFRVAMAMQGTGADMVAGGVGLIKDAGNFPYHTHHTRMPAGQVTPLPYERLLDVDGAWQMGDFFYQPEVFWTRKLWERAGGRVDETLFYSMDYELWVRFAKHGARLYHLPDTLVLFRVHAQQKTNMAKVEDLPFLPELRRVNQEFRSGTR